MIIFVWGLSLFLVNFTMVDEKENISPRLRIEGEDFRDLNFSGIDFSGASFEECIFTGAEFIRCDVSGVSFNGIGLGLLFPDLGDSGK